MKKIILINVGLLLTTIIFAQDIVEFSYDPTGNRVLREFIPDGLTSETNDSRSRHTQIETEFSGQAILFPNPASTELMVATSFSDEKLEGIKIINALGQEAMTLSNNELSTTTFSVDIKDLATGFYQLVFILKKEEPLVKPFVISRTN